MPHTSVHTTLYTSPTPPHTCGHEPKLLLRQPAVRYRQLHRQAQRKQQLVLLKQRAADVGVEEEREVVSQDLEPLGHWGGAGAVINGPVGV